MPKASDVKRGDVIEYDGQLLLVKEVDVQNPSARGAATLYKMRFTNIKTGYKAEERFKGDDVLTTVDMERRPVSFSYDAGDELVFMDDEDFTQYTFAKGDLGDDMEFIVDGITGCQVMTINGEPMALVLPQSVEMEVIDTPPPMRGSSASARSKPATFSTGLVIQVPEYLETGERVRIHTGERRFMGRAD